MWKPRNGAGYGHIGTVEPTFASPMATLHDNAERHRCSRFVIRHARREGLPVVVKDARSPAASELLRHEEEMLRRVEGPGVVRLLAVEGTDGAPSRLVLEDAGLQNLQQRIDAGPLPVDLFFGIATSLAETVARLHARRVVHGALAPARVILGAEGRVTLVHFEDASGLAEARPLEPARLGRALTWIAPEQSGHMNRPVDARADLYALGAIFYAMLTGAPPFRSTDPLELVHAHLAQVPVPAAIANRTVPRLLSDLVQKLLEKAPERRYQSAAGLVRDLQAARQQWEECGAIEPFELGLGDLAQALPLPEALYGRDAERALLVRALEEAAADGVRAVLVEGEPGIGKTALVSALRDETARLGGRFGAGKAAIRSSNVPYLPLTEALRALVRTASGRNEAVCRHLREVVAVAGRIGTELLSELDVRGDKIPAVANLEPVEAEQRFRTAVQGLVRALARDRPVVLFLDDLQWADQGSLRVLQALATDPEARRVLLVGSVRPAEAAADHPLWAALAVVERLGVPITRCALGPLDVDAAVDFLAATLDVERGRVRALAALVVAKTRGNPFFLRQFLRTLQREGLLVYDQRAQGWSWDLPQIERVGISSNVADLMARQIHGLPEAEQLLLQAAACAGPDLRPDLLAGLLDAPLASIEASIRSLVADGLLVRVEGAGVRFVHDRVQQAAYESCPEELRRALHRRIGRVLLAERGENMLYRAVDQLNLGAAPDEAPAQRIERARRNLEAGAGARMAAAHGSALAYFQTGLELVTDLPAPRALLYELHRDAAEAAFLTGQLDLANELALVGLAHATTTEEIAALQARRITALSAAGRLAEAIALGTEVLHARFGMEIPAGDLYAAAEEEHRRLAELLAGRSAEFLLDRPFDAASEENAFHLVLARMLPPAWFIGSGISPYLATRGVIRILEHTLSPLSIFSLAALPMSLAARGEFVAAEQFASIAVALARRSGFRPAEAAALHLEAMVATPWRMPFEHAVGLSREAFRLCVETGDPGEAANAWTAVVVHSVVGGVELDRILADIEEGLAFFARMGNEAVPAFLLIDRQLIRCLQGRTDAPGHLGDELFDEAAFEERIRGKGPVPAAFYHITRLRAAHLFGDLESARFHAEAARPHLRALGGFVVGTEHPFATALVLLAQTPTAAEWGRVRQMREQFAAWERSCPENFRHRRLLLDAEIARVEGRALDAAARYDESIEWATRGGVLHDAALANELAARHFHRLGRLRVARAYLGDAREFYARWGATGKVRALDEAFGVALGFEEAAPKLGAVGTLDVLSLLEAVESISGEIRFERLLPKLVEVCIRAVGAERGALVLEEGGVPVVRATGAAEAPVLLQETPLASSDAAPRDLIERVRRERVPVVIDDVRTSPEVRADPYLVRRKTMSLLAFPIRRKEELLGTLCFENSLATHAFAADRVRTLELLAPEIAVAIENARLFRAVQSEMEERTRAERTIRFLADASVILAGSLDYEQTLDDLAHLAVPAMADWCVIDLVEEGGQIRRVAGVHADPAKEVYLDELLRRYPPDATSPQPAGEILRSGASHLLPDVDDARLVSYARDEAHAALLRRLGLRSAMAVPLVGRGRVIGLLSFGSAAAGRFTAADLAVAEELARRAALAIDNARLYRGSQEAVQVREDFLSVASHELKTPITSMSVAIGSQLRKSDAAEDPSLQRTLTTAQRGLKRLNQLVDQLLDVSQIGSGELTLERQTIDLVAVVEEVVAAMQERIARSGAAVEVVAAGPVEGFWDRRRLGEVVGNLLDNALKFGEGKPVRIEVGTSEGAALLVVRDRGSGIAPERLPRVFERFERGVSSRHYGGWGLGLFLVRRIVEAHGGTVAAESLPGAGSSFTVRLPPAN